jgi:hypothetical protein
MNMMPSMPATTFSARRRIQSTALLMVELMPNPSAYGNPSFNPKAASAARRRHRPRDAANRHCDPRRAVTT